MVLIHVYAYKYTVGQLCSYGKDNMEFGFLPWNDGDEFLKANECLAWARFKDRSPLEHIRR